MAWGNTNSITTEFNSSMISLIRLNGLIDDCNHYSRAAFYGGYNIEMLKLWRNTLYAFHREVYPKMKKPERVYMKGMFNHGKKIGLIFTVKNTPDGQIKQLNQTKFKAHWNLLSRIDELLRKFADQKGMLVINKETGGSIIGEDE